ncbi:MAG: hypothetical protein ACRCZH_05125 [Cetobacterium sp.]
MIKVNFLDNKNRGIENITWGVPWEKGVLRDVERINLKSTDRKEESQSWPMAYWPDGSIKWSGLASKVENVPGKKYWLELDEKNSDKIKGIVIQENMDQIVVDTGKIRCFLNKFGKYLIEKILSGDKMISHSGKLKIIKEARWGNVREEIKLESKIKKISVEQRGDIRSVIKIEGIHRNSLEEKFPFTVRLVFFKDSDSIKILHTFFYNGNPEKDFIKGIGFEIKTNLIGDEFNKSIGFALEEGIYSEANKLLISRFFRKDNLLYEKQINCENVNREEIQNNKKLIESARENPSWNEFKLVQDSANHYKIKKRSTDKVAFIDVLSGQKSKGVIYLKDQEKGITFGIKDFWQKNPAGLEIKDFSKNETQITIWIWDPSGEPMDMRHYSENYHMSAYEGFKEIRSTPVGIANTSEIILKCHSDLPSKEEIYKSADEIQNPSLLVCEPEYYHATKACGIWSLPNYSRDETRRLEMILKESLEFYQREVVQREWYGYWNYGDFMHSYDATRNQWMYDIGGYAWQNTELMPNLWLWYQFFRTGDKEVFKMVEAMTRHNSEVDCYHFGQYEGLGSRHNVVHWGCSCKEARISMAILYKYYYYLTGDERTGEIIKEFKDADYSVERLEPLRGFYPKVEEKRFFVRTGPDWSAYCSNWETEWERTGNLKYRDKILKGMNYLKERPLKLLSGPSVLYDPETSEMEEIKDKSKSEFHMMVSFGAPQIWMEIGELFGDEEWKDMIAEFGEFYTLSDEEIREKTENKLSKDQFSWPMFSTAMIAYSAKRKNNSNLGKKAWGLIEDELNKSSGKLITPQIKKSWKELSEDPLVTTNCVAQWCLNTIMCLELIGDMLAEK